MDNIDVVRHVYEAMASMDREALFGLEYGFTERWRNQARAPEVSGRVPGGDERPCVGAGACVGMAGSSPAASPASADQTCTVRARTPSR
jgi:hypothetical protein